MDAQGNAYDGFVLRYPASSGGCGYAFRDIFGCNGKRGTKPCGDLGLSSRDVLDDANDE